MKKGPRFQVDDIVEQTNMGDVPFFVTAVSVDAVNRYELSGIDGNTYANIPEYMLVKARPAAESRWGKKIGSRAGRGR